MFYFFFLLLTTCFFFIFSFILIMTFPIPNDVCRPCVTAASLCLQDGNRPVSGQQPWPSMLHHTACSACKQQLIRGDGGADELQGITQDSENECQTPGTMNRGTPRIANSGSGGDDQQVWHPLAGRMMTIRYDNQWGEQQLVETMMTSGNNN